MACGSTTVNDILLYIYILVAERYFCYACVYTSFVTAAGVTPGGQPGAASVTPGGQPGGQPGGAPATPGGQPGAASVTPGGQPGGQPGGAPVTPGGQPGGAPITPGGSPGRPIVTPKPVSTTRGPINRRQNLINHYLAKTF